MNKKKKIFIKSFGAAVLILLTSFTMVIGKQSNHETNANSPLFVIRIQNTINREQKSVTTSYLGKGIDCKISFIQRETKIDLLQKIIEKISKMTDVQLMELVILINNHKITKENTQQILRLLYQLKNNPNEIKKQLNSIPNDCSHITKGCPPTTYPICMPTLDFWLPGCIFFWAWIILINVYDFIIYILEGG